MAAFGGMGQFGGQNSGLGSGGSQFPNLFGSSGGGSGDGSGNQFQNWFSGSNNLFPQGGMFPQNGPGVGNLNNMQQMIKNLENPSGWNIMNPTGLGSGSNPFFNLNSQGSSLGNNATGGSSLGLTQPQSGGDVNTQPMPGSNLVGSSFPNTNFTGMGNPNPSLAPNNPFSGNPILTTNGTSWAQGQGINAYPIVGGGSNGMLGTNPPTMLYGGQGFGVAGQGANGPNYFE